jgi:hypothetical protein
MMTTPERFEDRLLHELRQIVDGNPAPTTASHDRPLRRRIAFGAIGVATATAVVAIVATTSDVTPSAYAVQSGANGAVTVSIHSLSDAAGLQTSLRAAGVPAVVDYAPAGQAASCLPTGSATTATGVGSQPETRSTEAPGTSAGASSTGSGPTLTPASGGVPAGATTKVEVQPDGVRFTIDPGTIKPGQQVFITTSTGAVDSIGMSVGTTAAATACPAKQ